MTNLYNKQRPTKLDDVIGQDAIINSLKKNIDRGGAHAYLFHGPSGVGKTTLARIAAKMLGCGERTIEEHDGASFSTKPEAKELIQSVRSPSLFGDKRGVIVDECQRISTAAWDTFLKATEEPPPFLYWFFCTTEPRKVPATMKTRCVSYGLKPVGTDLLLGLLERIVEAEGLKTKDEIIKLCAKEADGSPRQAISNLEACLGAKNIDQAKELLASAVDVPAAIDLARAIYWKPQWHKIKGILQQLKDTNPESVRHVVRAYYTNVMIGAKTDKDAMRALEVIDLFSEPFHPSDGLTPLARACGLLCFNK